jgi:MFS family permease
MASIRLSSIVRRFLVNRNLALLWAGQVISEAGDAIFRIGALWLILEVTGSEGKTGLVAMAAYLPVLLFGPLAGVAADRADRKRLMLWADAGRAALVLAVPALILAGAVTTPRVALAAFGLSCLSIFFFPARDAYLPALVPARALAHANGLVQTSWQLAMLLGPGLAALLVGLVGILHLFTADSLTYLLSFLCILALRPIAGAADPEAARPRPGAGGWLGALRDLGEGFGHAVRSKFWRGLLWVTAVDNLFIMGPAIVGTPVFVKEVLGLGIREYALVEACYAAGALAGLPLTTYLCRRFPKGRVLLAGIVLDGITFLPLLWVRSLGGAMAVILVHSLAVPMIMVPRTTLVQERVPARLRGRLFSLVSFTVIGLTALSAALTGLVLEVVPADRLFGAIALLAAATGGVGWFLRSLREAS